MDQYIQTKNKSLGKLSAATFLKNDSEIVEITDHDINNSKYLFEIKHCQPQILHQGDQDISCSSFNLGFNNIQQESHKDIHERNSFFCKNQQDEAAQIAVQHNLGKNPSSYQAQPKNDLMEEEQQIKICLNMNKNVQCESQEGILIEENFSQSNCKDANNWKNDEQAQTNYFFSKNTIIKSESKNQSSQNQSESKHFNHSQMKMNSQILIQDDIFYENDKKKLGTKVNYALKSQYQQKQQFNSTINYKQNFQKATNIIGRLLNSSMNRVMRIRHNVKIFISLLKLRHSNRRFDNLSDQEFHSVNDLSHFQPQKGKIYLGYKFLKVFLFVLKYAKVFPVFMPSNTIRVIWDMIQVAFTYFFLYVYSLLIFFNQDYFQFQFIQKFNSTAFTLFLIDIIVNLNTAFFDKDTIIIKRILIAKQYFFSSRCLTDFISMFILGSKIINYDQFIIHDLQQNLFLFGFSILIFLKANGISSKKQRFNYIFTLTENQKHICKLINQLASVMTVAHIAAIGWYFVGIQEVNSYKNSWLNKIGIQSNSMYDYYIYAIYWSITTMTTVGYGDISATNPIEAIYISIAMILFSCVFAYSINNIGFILQEIEKSSKELNDDLVTIQRKNVSIQLKSRVRHYLSFLAQEQRDRDKLQEDKILFQLSNKLRDEITLEINSKILSNYNLFSSNFSKSTLNKLIFIMKEILVNPNEIIISEDKIDDSSIYFIQDGVIEIYQQQLQKQSQISIIQTLRDGQIFGDISFFTGLQRQASARSVNLSTLYKISRNEFIEILKENKEDFERFKMIQDSIIFQKGKSFIHNDCYYCKDSSHIASQCPRTHKQFDKQFIILKHNFSMFQERSNNRSNKKLKSNTKKQFKRNLEVIQRLRLSLQSQNNDLFSLYNDNQLSSYDTITESDNDNQEESVTESLVKSEIKEKEQNQKNNVKINEKEMIDQQTKNTLKLEKQKNEIEQQNNKQIYKCHSNLIIESYDPNKIAAKQFRSQARLRSLEATDNIDQANQESLNNVFNRQKSSQESNKISLKKDSDLNCVKMSDQQQQQIANQNEKDGSNLNNSKIFDKLKPHQQNLLPANAQISDQQKNQIKKMANLITINKQVGTQITSEEQNQSSNQDISYIKQNIKLENNIKVPANDQQSQSKKNSFLKYQNLVNQNPKEQRSSIDYQLQNIATLLYFHGKNMSQQQINNGIHCQQNNSSNNLDSNQSIIDEKDSISNSYTQKNNRLSFNKINHRENSQKTLQNQQSNEGCKKEIINEEKVIIERFSRILQNSQLPLLLQLTAGKSFLVGDSQFDQNPMDFFDKIQSFSKYYPDYNFDKIIRKLKSKQQKQKKLKRQATRERRQNVGLTKISIFQGNSKLVKIVPFSYDISLYQPTHLSYGTKIQKGTIYPINNFSKQII